MFGLMTIFGLYDKDDQTFARGLAGLVVCVGLYFAVGHQPASHKSGTDCYIDWDGRSNSTVCD